MALDSDRAARKHVTTACKPCRASKIKCNGEAPSCANCIRRALSCEYGDFDDKRKLPFRSVLAKLSTHVRELHGLLVANGSQSLAPAFTQSDMDMINKTLRGLGLEPLDNLQHNAPPAVAESVDPIRAESRQAADSISAVGMDQGLSIPDYIAGLENIDWNSYISSPDWPSMGFLAANDTPFDESAAMGTTVPPESQSSNSLTASGGASNEPVSNGDAFTRVSMQDEVDPELVGQIAGHIGSLRLGSDGQLQYYGAATNSQIFGTGRSTHAKLLSRTQSMKDEVHQVLQQAALDAVVEEDLAHHFLGLFFSCYNSCHTVVHEASFWPARQHYRELDQLSGLYSEVLDNMMCAIGASHDARYHSRLMTFPRTLAEFFADRAKALLDFELDNPCLATVQALILLSSHEAGAQKLARSSIYSGMAMRSAFDLGLHVPVLPYIVQGVISEAEARARQHTFWTSYIIDYHRSFAFGRPFTSDESHLRSSRPSAGLEDDFNTRICHQRLTLLDLVEPIARALYGDTSLAARPLQELSESCTVKMFAWREKLNELGLGIPTEDSSDSSSSTGAPLLVLHMEYHYLQILVHRPWTSRALQPIPEQGPGCIHARRTCIASASEMARLLCLFESRYGLRCIDVETAQLLPSAALILIFASISEHGDDRTVIAGHLNAVFRALDTLSNIFPSARTHLDSLLAIQQQWCAVYDHERDKRREAPGDTRETRRTLEIGQKRARHR